GFTAARKFVAAGISCGIKSEDVLDLALLVSLRPASAAGAYTTNSAAAAPVRLCRERLADGALQAVVVNSGAANACTGREGDRDARSMAAAAARCLGLPETSVTACSTGTIGRRLPLDRILPGVEVLAGIVASGGNDRAAQAIMTTDTVPKEAAVEFELEGKTVRVGGMAKGAGMIHPRLRVGEPSPHATMLSFISTDAGISAGALRRALAGSLEQSFNRVTVDGDTSTNDTVIVMANGACGAGVEEGTPGWELFRRALDAVTHELARAIAADGEGATKLVRFDVTGAAGPDEARTVAAAVANSLLLKCALFGESPNWGRVLAAIGYSGTGVEPETVSVRLDGIEVVAGGLLTGTDPDAVAKALSAGRLDIVIDLGRGKDRDFYYTCDISHEYVGINRH
ncbi:MAG TPA: bifunctional glutamate N-acetyltransferase/amino-acid acetyltransferase ArgJ, partial [bacterium]|nr:bifunctional glutamate N-acetyltransferase/amino-acid acetyltransferase ArgJ [bacterium]